MGLEKWHRWRFEKFNLQFLEEAWYLEKIFLSAFSENPSSFFMPGRMVAASSPFSVDVGADLAHPVGLVQVICICKTKPDFSHSILSSCLPSRHFSETPNMLLGAWSELPRLSGVSEGPQAGRWTLFVCLEVGARSVEGIT